MWLSFDSYLFLEYTFASTAFPCMELCQRTWHVCSHGWWYSLSLSPRLLHANIKTSNTREQRDHGELAVILNQPKMQRSEQSHKNEDQTAMLPNQFGQQWEKHLPASGIVHPGGKPAGAQSMMQEHNPRSNLTGLRSTRQNRGWGTRPVGGGLHGISICRSPTNESALPRPALKHKIHKYQEW